MVNERMIDFLKFNYLLYMLDTIMTYIITFCDKDFIKLYKSTDFISNESPMSLSVLNNKMY